MHHRISITGHSGEIVMLQNIRITSKLPANNPIVENCEKKCRSKPCSRDSRKSRRNLEYQTWSEIKRVNMCVVTVLTLGR